VEAVMAFLLTYGIPGVFAILAAWKTYRQRQAEKQTSVTQAAVDLLTTAIEVTTDPAVKKDVDRLSKGVGVDVARVIDSSLDRLNPNKIRDMIRTRKVEEDKNE